MGIKRRLGLLVRPDGHGLHAHIGFGHHIHTPGARQGGKITALVLYEFLIRRALMGAAEEDYTKKKEGYVAKKTIVSHVLSGYG